MLPSCVRSLRTCLEVAVACRLPHFATPLSIPSRWAFVRIRYARTANTTPPAITTTRPTVSARPVAASGFSRAARRARSRGCLPTDLPTSAAASIVELGVRVATRGYRQVTSPTATPTVSATTRRRRSGIRARTSFRLGTVRHFEREVVPHHRGEDVSTRNTLSGRALERRDVGRPASRSRPDGTERRTGGTPRRRFAEPS